MLKSVYYAPFLQLSMEQQVVLFVSLLYSITNGHLLTWDRLNLGSVTNFIQPYLVRGCLTMSIIE